MEEQEDKKHQASTPEELQFELWAFGFEEMLSFGLRLQNVF